MASYCPRNQTKTLHTLDEVCNTRLWFSPKFETLSHPAFTQTRAAKLYARGVRTERDYWLQHHHGILIWDEAQTRFPALENVQGWLIITTAIHTHFGEILQSAQLIVQPNK